MLAAGAAAGDILDLVGFGTFNVASIAASSITSGTMADARLPTTMASKTLTGANVTTNYNGLTVNGDGGSNDGQIQLNCSQNSHGVKIKAPPHSAGQSYTLTLPSSITNNYFLKQMVLVIYLLQKYLNQQFLLLQMYRKLLHQLLLQQ